MDILKTAGGAIVLGSFMSTPTVRTGRRWFSLNALVVLLVICYFADVHQSDQMSSFSEKVAQNVAPSIFCQVK
jgi:hypothetical protein